MSTALIYTIRLGDTLSRIANVINSSAGVKAASLETTNPGVNPNNLQEGQHINIPYLDDNSSTWIYTAFNGDSFASIESGLSQCYGIIYDDIEKNNSLTDIHIGKELYIPATHITDHNFLDLSSIAKNMGYWNWNWSQSTCPKNATMSIAFSGWTNIKNYLANSHSMQSKLIGTKYLSLNGNEYGRFTHATLTEITQAIQTGQLDGYDGVAYDVEEGDSGLAAHFAVCFKAAKQRNLKVLVTVSHSAPYDIDDADDLMHTFLTDDNIDILSPQLYITGEESTNNFQLTSNTETTWADYANSKAIIVPSIITASLYNSAKNYFNKQGVELDGYIQWRQTA